MRKLLLVVTMALAIGCVHAKVELKDGRTVSATALGQANVTLDPETGVLEVWGGKLSEVFDNIMDGLFNAIPFGRGTQPDINIIVPSKPAEPVNANWTVA